MVPHDLQSASLSSSHAEISRSIASPSATPAALSRIWHQNVRPLDTPAEQYGMYGDSDLCKKEGCELCPFFCWSLEQWKVRVRTLLEIKVEERHMSKTGASLLGFSYRAAHDAASRQNRVHEDWLLGCLWFIYIYILYISLH